MAESNLTKNKAGYGYKYTDLAQIHEYLEKNNMRYYQYVETTDGKDYIMTVPIIDGVEQKPRRGVQIVDAVLNGIKNPAQEQGSATTYARRYSLLMAFGLATEDDDGASLTKPKLEKKDTNTKTITKDISEDKISQTYISSFKTWVQNHKIASDFLLNTLKDFGYDKIEDIKYKDYKKIVNKLNESLKGDKNE